MGDDAPDLEPTNLTLKRRHKEWADRHNKNLSAEVRELLDKRIRD